MRRGTLASGLAALLVAVAIAAPAPVGARQGAPTSAVSLAQANQRTEVPVGNPGDPADGVAVTVVTLYDPLPAGSPTHPAECDHISYLKYRRAGSSPDPARADAVLVAQPGANGGAMSLDRVARNTITQGAARGRSFQFWSIDRRGNCLEDNTGLVAAARAGDYRIAIDYYYRGRQIDGRRFSGWRPDDQLDLVAELGFARSVLDEHTLLTREIPDPAVRRSKVLLGGHSLGGFITGTFAAWDFDGTEAGRGYNQAAGFFALDTLVTADPVGLQSIPGVDWATQLIGSRSHAFTVSLLRAGLLPRTETFGVVNEFRWPEAATFFHLVGTATHNEPEVETQIDDLTPASSTVDSFGQLVLSDDWTSFVFRSPSWRRFRFTNEALFGTLVDDNSQPIGALEGGVGTYDSARVKEKNFPLPADAARIPGIGTLLGVAFGLPTRIIPTSTSTLYRWRNFDEMAGAPLQLDDEGRPVTSPASEPTDINDMARAVNSGPLNYLEAYFPTRMLIDVIFIQAGARDGDLAPIRFEEELQQKPILTIMGGESFGTILPDALKPDDTVVLPGYTHLDVTTAAPVLNDGQLEPTARNLVDFAIAHTT